MTEPIAQLIAAKIRAAFGPNAALEALQPLTGDASSRRYYRARLSGSGSPGSVVAMELAPGSGLPLSSEELAIFDRPPQELPFLNVHRFLTRVGVKVPALYGHWADQRVLLLEDLGDTALWDRVQGLPEADVESWYQRAIDELLGLHVRGTLHRDDSCIAFQQRFDFKLYMWEFEHFIEYGLVKRPGARIDRAKIERLRQTCADIARILEREEPCLTHRDYHSWNLMIHNETVRVIDFQDALLAPPQYDVASLLNDRVTDSIIGPAMEERLVRYYLDQKDEMAPCRGDRGRFFELYRLSAIQRDLKVVGRFYYLDQVKGKPGYMKFVPPTVRRLRRNLALAPQTQSILSFLDEHFEAMA